MRLRHLFLVALSAGGLLFAREATPRAATTAPVGAGAVWNPPPEFLKRFHAACDERAGGGFSACFLAQMEKAGAPQQALDFSRRTDGMGYLRAFRDTGVVDVAYAEYPFRANENRACFLVNGEPPLLDVDDPKLLDPKRLAANPVYAGIAKRHPKVALFPADRGGPALPEVEPLEDGGLRVIVEYALRDGCHACAAVGTARFGFRFDGTGRFLRTEILAVRPRG
jgi:hypothetical protein